MLDNENLDTFRILASELDELAGESKKAEFIAADIVEGKFAKPAAHGIGNFVSDLKLSDASDAIRDLVGYIVVSEGIEND